jgi:hypothetical protein
MPTKKRFVLDSLNLSKSNKVIGLLAFVFVVPYYYNIQTCYVAILEKILNEF